MDIQEEFEETRDYYESKYSYNNPQNACEIYYKQGYKAGQDSLACCGCCEWYSVYRSHIVNSESGQWCNQIKAEVGFDGYECKGENFTPRSKE